MSTSITIQLLHPDARQPQRATEGSAGYDLFAYLTDQIVTCADAAGTRQIGVERDAHTGQAYLELPAGTTAMVPLGFKARLPMGFEAQIRPRSGTSFKKGLLIPNTPGTVDSDYPDEWKVLIRNLGPNVARIEHGERIAQMVIARYEVLGLVEGTVERSTTRAGGFGSTGA